MAGAPGGTRAPKSADVRGTAGALKFDPPFGERVLREDFARPNAYPACYDLGFQFREYGRWAYSPALEKLAVESLTSPNVLVKRGAAEILGKFGSPAAEKPLWDAMDYFHSWWSGKEDGLRQREGEGSVQLERALRIALAQADGWVVQETELNRLQDLCSTEWCRTEITQWRGAARQPIEISAYVQDGEPRYRVGQYGFGDQEWLLRKLLQYPKATTFRVAGAAQMPGMNEALERARTAVRAAARTLVQ